MSAGDRGVTEEPNSTKLIEFKNVTDDVEISFSDAKVEYVVYARDTQGNLHILKTHDDKSSRFVFQKDQQDFIIEEIYVQIQNNSAEEQEAGVSFEVKSGSEG